MNHINRHSLMATLLATCCFCSTTLLGGLDNIWYTYDIFLTPAVVTDEKEEKAKTELIAAAWLTQEVKRPTPSYPNLKYEPLALIHGLAAIEMGVIRNIYDMAPRFDFMAAEPVARKKAEEEIAKRIKEDQEQLTEDQKRAAIQRETNTILHEDIAKHIGLPAREKGSAKEAEKKEAKQPDSKEAKQPDGKAIIRLVHTIFHRQNPRQLSVSDFVTTDKLKDCTKDTIATFIGILNATIAQGQGNRNQFSTKSITNWINNLDESMLKNEVRKQLDTKEAGAAVNHSKLTLHDIVRFAIQSVTPAYLEKSPFPAKTVYLVLLGLLYQHTGLDQPSVEAYYTALESRYTNLASIKTAYNAIALNLKDARLPKSASEINKLKKQLIQQGNDLKASSPEAIHFIQFTYEPFVFLSLLPGVVPPECSYSDAIISVYDPSTNTFTKKASATFTDCMDTAMRNIFNTLAYDSATKLFSIATLLANLQAAAKEQAEQEGSEIAEKKEAKQAKTPAVQTIKPVVQAFYTRHPSPLNTGSDDATQGIYPHSDWSAVISNIPYVAYTRISTSNETKDWPGYIRIPAADLKSNQELEAFIKERQYTLIHDEDKTAILYEIQPSLRNVIIAIDYLLNLNLFNGNLAEVFAEPTFVQTYLPRLCKALNAELTTNNNTPLEEVDAADTKGSHHTALITLVDQPKQVHISVSSGHGVAAPIDPSAHFDLPIFRETLAHHKELPTSAIFFHHSNPVVINSLKDPKTTYLALFSTALANPDRVSDLCYKNCPVANKEILDLLSYGISRHPDQEERLLSSLQLYTTYCKRHAGAVLDDDSLRRAFTLILHSLIPWNQDLRITTAAEELFEQLAAIPQHDKVLIEFIDRLQKNNLMLPDSFFSHTCPNLINLFMIRALPQTLNLIKSYKDPRVKLLHSIDLYRLRCSQAIDQSTYKQALEVLQNATTPEAQKIYGASLSTYIESLLSALAKQHADLFIPFLPNILKTDPRLLIESKESLECIAANLKTADPIITDLLVQMVCTQVKDIQNDAGPSGNFGFSGENPYINALNFLQKLVESDWHKIYSNALDIAINGPYIKSSQNTTAPAANYLLSALITKGFGLDRIKKELTNTDTSLYKRLFLHFTNDGRYHPSSINTLEALINQNCCIETIVDQFIANLYVTKTSPFLWGTDVTALSDYTPLITHRAARLTQLFENKAAYAYEKSLKAASDLWKTVVPQYNGQKDAQENTKQLKLDLFFKEEALALFKFLFTYEQGRKEAIAIAHETLNQLEPLGELLEEKGADKAIQEKLAQLFSEGINQIKPAAIDYCKRAIKLAQALSTEANRAQAPQAEIAKKAAAAQEAAAKKTKAMQEDAAKAAQADAAKKEEEQPTMTQASGEPWTCRFCEFENKPGRAVCKECGRGRDE